MRQVSAVKYKKIVFATDFSPASQAALAYAASLARDSDALLLIAQVEDSMTPYGSGDQVYYALREQPNPEVRRMLEAIVPPGKGVRYEHRLVLGAAADEIVRLADEEGADLIVIGTHGRTGVTRVLMGSVAEAVVRRAKCPVLTLKQHAPSGAGAK
jgi:universal stress protein A